MRYFLASIRNPGTETFNTVNIYRDYAYSKVFEAGITIDKTNLRRHVHLFGMGYMGRVYHYNSSNNGAKWSHHYIMETGSKNDRKFNVAVNTQAQEGGVHMQYRYNKEARVMSSNNHGRNFGTPVRVGPDNSPALSSMALDLCGLDGKGIVLSGVSNYNYAESYIRYLPLGTQHFLNLPYPFEKISHGSLETTAVACR